MRPGRVLEAEKECAAPHAQQASHGNDSIVANLKWGMTRAAAIDDDLRLLADDMNMFVGVMKIEAMARVITLLVERLSIMREQMMDVHELMMRAPFVFPGESETRSESKFCARRMRIGSRTIFTILQILLHTRAMTCMARHARSAP